MEMLKAEWPLQGRSKVHTQADVGLHLLRATHKDCIVTLQCGHLVILLGKE